MDLPAELERLEEEILAGASGEPSEAVGLRILGAVRGEIRRRRRRERTLFVLGVAASMLLWMNLSWSAAGSVGLGWMTAGDARRLSESGEQLRRLLPELSPQEARRQALVLLGRGELPTSRGAMGALPSDPF